MSFFSWRRKTLNISEEDPMYKVKYLGNIHTCMMKGDGCVDKPASILWNNYLQSSHQALDMKMVVSVSGIKAHTKEQGLMQYWSHKISYLIAHPQYPKMFLWVYRHEGRKMKLDLRCHAVLCKTEAKAKLLAVQLHDKLSFALKEFVREKRRKHNSRLIIERTKSETPHGSILPLRQQMLSQGGKFKPPVSKMNSAPKLGSICELDEEEEEEYEEEDIGEMNGSLDEDEFCIESDLSDGLDALTLDGESDNSSFNSDRIIDLEIGNDIDELKHDDDVKFYMNKKKKKHQQDSDGESSESGFSDNSKEIGLYSIDESIGLDKEREPTKVTGSAIATTSPVSGGSRKRNYNNEINDDDNNNNTVFLSSSTSSGMSTSSTGSSSDLNLNNILTTKSDNPLHSL